MGNVFSTGTVFTVYYCTIFDRFLCFQYNSGVTFHSEYHQLYKFLLYQINDTVWCDIKLQSFMHLNIRTFTVVLIKSIEAAMSESFFLNQIFRLCLIKLIKS